MPTIDTAEEKPCNRCLELERQIELLEARIKMLSALYEESQLNVNNLADRILTI